MSRLGRLYSPEPGKGSESKTFASLSRARGASRSVKQKRVVGLKAGGSAVIYDSDMAFKDIIAKFRGIEQDWAKRKKGPAASPRVTSATAKARASGLMPASGSRPRQMTVKMSPKMAALKSENDELQNTVKSLVKKCGSLEAHNEAMAKRMEDLKDAMSRSKTFSTSLVAKVQSVNDELRFQSDLHKSERSAWKKALGTAVPSPRPSTMSVDSGATDSVAHMRMPTVMTTHSDVSWISQLTETVQKQYELVQCKTEELRQSKLVHATEVQSLKNSFTKEIQHMRLTHAQDMHRLLADSEAVRADRGTDKAEMSRLKKELQVTSGELEASKKHLDSLMRKTAKAKGDCSPESQLMRVERDYMNLMETLATAQRECRQLQEQREVVLQQCAALKQSDKNARQQTLEMKETISLLQRNLCDAKRDRSDLIAHLQQEWAEEKQRVLCLKDVIRQKEGDLERLKEASRLWQRGEEDLDEDMSSESEALSHTGDSRRPVAGRCLDDDHKVADTICLALDGDGPAVGGKRQEEMDDLLVRELRVAKELAEEKQRSQRLVEEVTGQQLIIGQLLKQAQRSQKRSERQRAKMKGMQSTIADLMAEGSAVSVTHVAAESDLETEDALVEMATVAPLVVSESMTTEAGFGGMRARRSSRPALVFSASLGGDSPADGKSLVHKRRTVVVDLSAMLADMRSAPGEFQLSAGDALEMVAITVEQSRAQRHRCAIGEAAIGEEALDALDVKSGLEGVLRSLVRERLELFAKVALAQKDLALLRRETTELTDIHTTNVERLEQTIDGLQRTESQAAKEKVALQRTLVKMHETVSELQTEVLRLESMLEMTKESSSTPQMLLPSASGLSPRSVQFAKDSLDEDFEVVKKSSKKRRRMKKTRSHTLLDGSALSGLGLAQMDAMKQRIATLQKEKEAIAAEFETEATLWMNSRAEVESDRMHFQNEFARVVSKLEAILGERAEFQKNCAKWKSMYLALLSELNALGIEVSLECEYDSNGHVTSAVARALRCAPPSDRSSTTAEASGSPRSELLETPTQKRRAQSAGSEVQPMAAPKSPKSAVLKLKERFASKKLTLKPRSDERSKSAVAVTRQREDACGGASPMSPSSSIRKKQGKKVWQEKVFSSDDLKVESEGLVAVKTMGVGSTARAHCKRAVDYEPSDDYLPWSDPPLYEFVDDEYLQHSVKLKFEQEYFFTTMGQEHEVLAELSAEQLVAQKMDADLRQKEQRLAKLEGWLEKQSPSFHKHWQKRYVLVLDYNIFYMKKKVSVSSVEAAQRHSAFSNVIPLVVVQYVQQSDAHKSGRKFEVVAMDPRTGDRRVYQWRAESREQCLDWVEGLNEHKKMLTAKMMTSPM